MTIASAYSLNTVSTHLHYGADGGALDTALLGNYAYVEVFWFLAGEHLMWGGCCRSIR
jgi:hypothetical protein